MLMLAYFIELFLLSVSTARPPVTTGRPTKYISSFLLKHFHIPTRSKLSSWNVYSIKPLFVGSEVHTFHSPPHSWHCAVVLDRRTRRLEHVIPAFVSESCKLCQLNPSVLEALNIPCLRTVNSCYHRRFVKTSKSNAM